MKANVFKSQPRTGHTRECLHSCVCVGTCNWRHQVLRAPNSTANRPSSKKRAPEFEATPALTMLTVALSMLAVSHTSVLLPAPVRTGAIATRTNAAIVMCSDEHHDVWLQRLVDAHAKAKRAEREVTGKREEDEQSTSSLRASHRGPAPQMISDDDAAKSLGRGKRSPLSRRGPSPAHRMTHRKAWEGRLHNLKNIGAIIDHLMAA